MAKEYILCVTQPSHYTENPLGNTMSINEKKKKQLKTTLLDTEKLIQAHFY